VSGIRKKYSLMDIMPKRFAIASLNKNKQGMLTKQTQKRIMMHPKKMAPASRSSFGNSITSSYLKQATTEIMLTTVKKTVEIP
jgi:hypothetical protein